MIEELHRWKETGCDAWASHIPLLLMNRDVNSVLELGMGKYSTSLFLDKNLFPDLHNLVSVESNSDWAASSSDDRHHILLYPEPIEHLLDTLVFDDFDLIFVDNSDSADRRIATLKYVSSRRPSTSKVFVHDWERYHDAVTGYEYAIVDDRQLPHSALVWGWK